VLNSPIDGIISELLVHEGDYIDNPQSYSLKIADLKSQTVNLFVPQSIVPYLKKDKEVILNKSNESVVAILNSVAPVVDPKTGSIFIEIKLPKAPQNWIPGMYVEAKIPLEETKGQISVPTRSIIFENGKAFVYIIKNMDDAMKNDESILRGPASQTSDEVRVKKIPVEVGISEGEFSGVSGAIAEFDQVVSEGLSGLSDGTSVEIMSF
jgi:RND family efflux transporter MFP subunit